MGTATLVDERLDAGSRLIRQLHVDGFDVRVAVWALVTDEERWLLYIASQVVDDEGLGDAYLKLNASLARTPERWLLDACVRLLSTRDPLVSTAISFQEDTAIHRYGGRKIGDIIIDDAFIYPK